MKFKLRVIDQADSQGHQNPLYPSQSSSSSSPYTYFPQQPIPGGYPAGSFTGGHGGPEMFRERFDMRDAIQREIEKERIREEIIAEEMNRKRILEEEVRHELMMEREMMVFRGGGGFPAPYMPLPLPPTHNNLLEPRILHRQPIGGGGGYPPEIRGFDVVPFHRFSDSPIIDGIPTPLSESSQKELIILGKPRGETFAGTKRKPEPQVTGESSGSYSDTSKKRITEEWSCAICKVTATSERGLTEHLQGKKHQLKEAALIAKKTGANHGLGVHLKKPVVKIGVTTVNLRSGKGKSKPGNRSVSSGNRTSSSMNETSSSVNGSNDLKEKDDERSEERKKGKFKFWCEMCKVGAYCEKVMDNHKEGKKHSVNLVALFQKCKPEIPCVGTTEVGEGEGKSDMEVEEEDESDDTSVSL